MVDLDGKLRLSDAMTHSVRHVGQERAPVLVVDSFLSDAQVLVDHAATHAQFDAVSDTFYPGIRAPLHPIYSFALRAFLGELIGSTFGFGSSRVVRELSTFSLVTTAPGRLKVLQRLPHYDNTDERQLALLHYLCPAHHGGTSFYRHRATGFESIRPQHAAEYLTTLNAEVAAQGPPPADYIRGDTPLFERIASFEAQFNRVLIYRSINLHSADIPPDLPFSADPRSGRLTANTFFFYR